MKALILAAGYGTRLERDLKADKSGKYKHLIGVPKPLLPIGGKPLISRWMECLIKEQCISDVYVVTNSLHYDKFKEWSINWPNVKLIDDGTTTNEGRLGAVRCIKLCVDKIVDKNDHLMIIGGDTLFLEDFNLQSLMKQFELNVTLNAGAQVLCYKCADKETTKFGILELNKENVVSSFLEKPSPDSTDSRWADAPLQEKDAPGNLLRYLYSRVRVFAMEISGRFDVGGLQSYIDCNQHF